MPIMQSFIPAILLGLRLSAPVLAQSQNVQYNQVINLNGDMNLNSFTFPDGSKIETYSQLQQQMIVNQNTPSVAASHVTGSTGQPFVQLSPNTMTIQTDNATNLVGGQIEMAMNTQLMQQMNISPDNTFVAQLSPDRQAWMVMEGIKNVNITDGTVRMLKLTSIDGEYMAIGRQTPETSNVLTPFGNAQQQTVAINGSGIQEVEFQDGFRMSVKASQPMTVNTVYKNGVSNSMVVDGSQPVNNYRYLVTTNLAAVQPNLNNMMAVVQMPLNAQRVMTLAMQMGANAQSSIQLGIEQRPVIQNPGGATGNLNSIGGGNRKRQGTPTYKRQNNNNNNNGGNAVASQLLLAPTFTPVNAPTVLDRQNGRIATTVGQLDGEFIIVMKMAGQGQQQGGQGQQLQPGQAAPVRQAEPVGARPAGEPALAQPGEPAGSPVARPIGEPALTRPGEPAGSPVARPVEPVGSPVARPIGEPVAGAPVAAIPATSAPVPVAAAPIPGAVAPTRPIKRQAPVTPPATKYITMTMAELQLMATEQKYGGIQATKLMSEYLTSQGGAAAAAPAVRLTTRRRRSIL